MENKALWRYTNLAATIHHLRSKTITLLNPTTWDDRNDAFFLEQYKNHVRAESVLALCLTERPGRYHHWRVFSHGSDGVCIRFSKDGLLSAFDENQAIIHQPVTYMKLDDLSAESLNSKELPFLKRSAYRDEKEYRIIYVDKEQTLDSREFTIELDWIKSITLSPWLPKEFVDSVKDTLKSIPGCKKLNIGRSYWVESENWKNAGRKLTK